MTVITIEGNREYESGHLPIVVGGVYILYGMGDSYVRVDSVDGRYVTIVALEPNKGTNRILKSTFNHAVKDMAGIHGAVLITEGSPTYYIVAEDLAELLWS